MTLAKPVEYPVSNPKYTMEKEKGRVENYRCYLMVNQAHLSQLAQNHAKTDQEFSTETSIILRLQVVEVDCFEMRKFLSSTIHHP